MERAFHVARRRFVERPRRFGEALLAVAEPSGEDIRTLVAELSADSPRPKTQLSRRAGALEAAARRFLDRADPLRRRALEGLPAVTGFSRPMIEEALPRIFAPLAGEAFEAIVGRSSAPPVPLAAVVSAGNIPGVALPQMTLALAAGSACFVKTAAGEPLLCALFGEALSSVDADLGRSLAVVWWQGGDAACERALAAGANSLVVYGSDEAISAWAAYHPRRLVSHGHRTGIAVVRLDAGGLDLEASAVAAARDVVLYDQLGCLSPQSIFTIGGDHARRAAFVDGLATALADLEYRLPRGTVPEAQQVAIRRLRDEYEWREIRGEGVRAIPTSEAATWTVLDDPTPGHRPSPLYRTVFVRRVEALEDLPRALGEWLPRIESAGIAPWPDAEVVRLLADVPRKTSLGTMQSPDLEWRQGGVDPMTAIVEEEIR